MGDLVAAAAGLLQPGGLDQLQLGRDQCEDLADILTDQTQGAAAVRAILTGVQHDALAGCALSHQGLPAARSAGHRHLFFCAAFGVVIGSHRADRCRRGNLQMLQRQFKLFYRALDTVRAGAELLLLKACDLDLQRLNQRLMGAKGGRHLRDIGLNAPILGGNPGILGL